MDGSSKRSGKKSLGCCIFFDIIFYFFLSQGYYKDQIQGKICTLQKKTVENLNFLRSIKPLDLIFALLIPCEHHV